MIAKSRTNIKRFLLSLLILCGLASSLYSQDKKINDIINIYKHVEAIGIDNVTLTDVTGLIETDTVLLIQMKGGIISALDDPSFGSESGYYGAPGMNEFLIIEDITGSVVTFTNNILNTYDIDEFVQMVRVPYYNSAIVDATLSCQPWDNLTKTGGVLAVIVGRSLSLNADIDVSGKGFPGGETTLGDGVCASTAGMNFYYYAYSFTNSGNKGDGVATTGYVNPSYYPLFPDYAKGKGANFTGGGGGNGKYAGGGGGSNWGDGGNGGVDGCLIPGSGGLGGNKIFNTALEYSFINNLFMGGGGGGSTHASAGTPSSPGAKGGGIVIIVCDTLKGNGRIINAQGGSPVLAVSGNAGAGGGGGGGSVALYLQSYSSGTSSALTVSVNGGKGGNTSNAYGVGGGGGGGLIRTNSITTPANVIKTYSGGAVGSGGGSGSSGGSGDFLNTFLPNLNGFLYNSIRSAVTGDQTDSICSNMPFGVISGTIPFSGTIQWQSTTVANPLDADFIDISGATAKDYTPGVLTQTTWFRRVVTETGPPPIVDKSKPVKIIVQPFIENNEIGNPDTVCYGQNPKMLISTNTLAGGSTTDIYRYKWSVSTDNSVFTDTVDNNTAEAYTPEPGLTLTSWYKRTVTSGRCVDSSALVRINVLDTISNNEVLSLPQDICFGMTFADLTATTPATTPALAGGDNAFRYLWISSINGAAWGPAPGINSASGYNPAELAERDPSNEYKFMRIIRSGSQDVCVDTTSMILLRDYPVLTNNLIITAEQKICSGSVPAILTATDPLKGNGTYTYFWQDSSAAHTWDTIPGAINRDFQPPALTDTTSYRRIVISSECSDFSKSVRINVHKLLTNNIVSLISGGTDTSLCDGANPGRFAGTMPAGGTNLAGDYAYEWLLSPDNSNWSPVAAGGTGQGYDPPALNATTYYKRKVLSGSCTDISASTITVTVLPLISNNILSDPPVICKDYIPAPITGNTPAGGSGIYKYLWLQSSDNGASWLPATGTNNDPSGNYQPPALSTDMKYRRVVNSGDLDCCRDTSDFIELLIHKLPSSPVYAGPDTTIYSPDGYYIMRASPIDLTYETGLWTGDGRIITPTDNHTEVELTSAITPNKFLWTVTNGPCINKASVSITFLNIEVPNGFSPNGDGMNDVFEVKGLETEFQIVELSIINSAGTEVFHTTNKNNQQWNDWDGKNSKGVDLPEGTYYYILMIDPDKTEGSLTKKSGFIVLKRR